MKRFKTISDYISESQGDITKIMNRNAQDELVTAIIESGHYDDNINFAFDIVLENNLLSKLFEGTLTDEDIVQHINEASIKDWFKDKSEKVKDKAKDALTNGEEFVKKIGGNFNTVAKVIGKALSEFFKKAWEWMKKNVADSLNASGKKEKLESTVSNLGPEEKKGTGSEIKDMQSISKAVLDYFMKGVPQAAAQGAAVAGKQVEVGGDAKNEHYEWSDVFEHATYIAFTEAIKEDSNILNELEDAINEGGDDVGIKIPFVSKIVQWIAGNVPPFSLLDKVENYVAKQVGHGMEKFSMWASKVAKAPGPKKFPHLAKLAGMYAGALTKTGTKEIIGMIAKKGVGMAIISAFPGIGSILSWMKKIATWMWWFEVTEAALGLAVKATAGEQGRRKLNKASGDTQVGTKGLDKAKKAVTDTVAKAKPKPKPAGA